MTPTISTCHSSLRTVSFLQLLLLLADDCGSPDTSIMIGPDGCGFRGSNVNTDKMVLEIYVRGATPAPTISATPTATPTATLSNGAQPSSTQMPAFTSSVTGSSSGSVPPSGTRSGSATPSYTPTGTHTVRASDSQTATPSYSATVSATATVSPYCNEDVYLFYPAHDVAGNVSLGASLTANHRDCARACCDVAGCDGYAWVSGYSGANCFLYGSVTYINHISGFTAGVRKRALL